MTRFRSSRPYWINVKYPGKCSGCNADLHRNDEAFYYPATRTMLCKAEDCGKKAAAELAANDFDTAQMGWE
jgi:hypothetical protein